MAGTTREANHHRCPVLGQVDAASIAHLSDRLASLHESIIRLEEQQSHTHESVKRIEALLTTQNGSIRELQTWRAGLEGGGKVASRMGHIITGIVSGVITGVVVLLTKALLEGKL